MINDCIKKDYLNLINEDFPKYKKDFENLLANRKKYGATYKEEELPTLYDAYFYNDSDHKKYKKMIDIFMSIVKKVTDEYIKNPDYRKEFGFDKLTEKLILKDPGYDVERSEEHTSELQSRGHLVCRLLLETKQ